MTHSLGDGDGVRRRNVHEQTCKLLTTDSREQVIGPHRVSHNVAKAAQRPVARQMPVRVIDEFELVKVECDERYSVLVNCGPPQASRCMLQKSSSIPNACQ